MSAVELKGKQGPTQRSSRTQTRLRDCYKYMCGVGCGVGWECVGWGGGQGVDEHECTHILTHPITTSSPSMRADCFAVVNSRSSASTFDMAGWSGMGPRTPACCGVGGERSFLYFFVLLSIQIGVSRILNSAEILRKVVFDCESSSSERSPVSALFSDGRLVTDW